MPSEIFFGFAEEEKIYKLSTMAEKLFASLLRVSRNLSSYTKITVVFVKRLLLYNLIPQNTVLADTAVFK